MNPWKGLKGLPHNLWVLSFTTLINRAGTMVLPFLAIYLTKSKEISASEAGLVLTCYGAGALITAPFVGKLSDTFGSLRIMKISLFVSGLVLILYSFISNYYLILLTTLAWAVISEAFRPANLVLISEVVKPEQRRTAFALNRLAINLGMSIGPVAGGFLILFDYSIIFYVDGITSIAAGIFLALSKWDFIPVDHDAASDIDLTKKLLVLKDRRYLFFLIAMIPIPIIFFQHLGAMALYIINDLGNSPAVFGLLAGVNTLIIILIEVPLTNSLKHWSDRKSLAIGALLFGIGFGLMALWGNIYYIAFTVVVWTFGEMIFFPASANYASEIAPPKRRGEYMGFFQMAFSLAFTVGPWAGNIVYEHLGANVLWYITFVLGLLSFILMLRLDKSKAQAS